MVPSFLMTVLAFFLVGVLCLLEAEDGGRFLSDPRSSPEDSEPEAPPTTESSSLEPTSASLSMKSAMAEAMRRSVALTEFDAGNDFYFTNVQVSFIALFPLFRFCLTSTDRRHHGQPHIQLLILSSARISA